MDDQAFRPTVFLRVGHPSPGKTATTCSTAAAKLTLPAPVYVDGAAGTEAPAAAALPAFVFLRQAHDAAAYTLMTGGGFPRVWASGSSGGGGSSGSCGKPGYSLQTDAGVLRTLSTVCPRRFLRPTRVALWGTLPSASDATDAAAFSLDRPRGSTSTTTTTTTSSARLRFRAPPPLGGRFEWTAEPGPATLTLWHVVAGARRVVVARLHRSSGQLAIDGEAARQREQLVVAVVTTALCAMGGI